MDNNPARRAGHADRALVGQEKLQVFGLCQQLRVARQLGLPAPPQITLKEAKAQFSKERMAFLSDSRVVDTRKMRDVLGVRPDYADPADGISASL